MRPSFKRQILQIATASKGNYGKRQPPQKATASKGNHFKRQLLQLAKWYFDTNDLSPTKFFDLSSISPNEFLDLLALRPNKFFYLSTVSQNQFLGLSTLGRNKFFWPSKGLTKWFLAKFFCCLAEKGQKFFDHMTFDITFVFLKMIFLNKWNMVIFSCFSAYWVIRPVDFRPIDTFGLKKYVHSLRPNVIRPIGLRPIVTNPGILRKA